jgi:uncharacterized protein DUF1629
MGFFVLTLAGVAVKGAAILELPEDLGVDLYEVSDGSRLKGRLHARLLCAFDPDYKEGRKLLDLVPNTDGVFPVSPALKTLLSKEPEIEFLPIRIADHRGKIASSDYTLANFLGTVDCVNMKASKYVKSALDDDEVSRFTKLVIDPKKVPKGRHAFRLRPRPRMVVVDDEIRDAVAAAKPTGVGCVPLEEFDTALHVGT